MSRRSLRRVFFAATVSCFAAGVAVGLAVPVVVSVFAGQTTTDWEEDYAQRLRERYGLSAQQAREIRMVLRKRDLDHRQLLSESQDLPPELRDRVRQISRHAEERIKYVLTEEQRPRYLRDAALNNVLPAAEDERPDAASDRGKE